MCFATAIVILFRFTLFYTTDLFDHLSLALATCEVSHGLAQLVKRHNILAGEIVSCLWRTVLHAKSYQDILKLGILFQEIKWETDCSLRNQLMGIMQNKKKKPPWFPVTAEEKKGKVYVSCCMNYWCFISKESCNRKVGFMYTEFLERFTLSSVCYHSKSFLIAILPEK